MAKAIGMIEFLSIAKGIETCDLMTKASRISIIKSSTICPGKYISIITGDISEINSAMEVGLKNAAEAMVDHLIIPNIDSQVIRAISMVNPVDNIKAIGVIEFYSAVAGVLAADIAVKSADITLVEVKIGYAIGGKGVVILTGEVSAVNVAVKNAIAKTDLLCQYTVIPRPSQELIETLL